MYGNGYCGSPPITNWYPGFNEWGMRRPIMPWFGWSQEQPELVLENEVPVGPDGKVEIVIDTMTAKELHGNQDHKYSITAEVTDQSRRTIVGTGNVLSRASRSRSTPGSTRGTTAPTTRSRPASKAQTLDQKPVQGKAR